MLYFESSNGNLLKLFDYIKATFLQLISNLEVF